MTSPAAPVIETYRATPPVSAPVTDEPLFGSSAARPTQAQKTYHPRGAARELMRTRDKVTVLDGPAGTGKSRACLEKIFIACSNYPKSRWLLFRKTRESLTESALYTWEEKVLPEGHAALGRSNLRRSHRQAYFFPNGAEVIISGLDKPQKIMSTEFDGAYCQEMTECSEEDIEMVTTRLRNGVMPYQQLIGDCNPDKPTHFLWRNSQEVSGDAATINLLHSKHEDNPVLWNESGLDPDTHQRTGYWTEAGLDYIATLDRLTGPRKERLRFGRWVTAEGTVYEVFDPYYHMVNRFDPYAEGGDLYPGWHHEWVFDFGYNHPFVWQNWLVCDHDNRGYLYQEIYQTGVLVEEHAKLIAKITERQARPMRVLGDHDAEGRKTLEKYLKVRVTPAFKKIREGIQAVQVELRLEPVTLPAGVPLDPHLSRVFYRLPNLTFMRDSLVHPRDQALADKKAPTCTVEEFDGYVWDIKHVSAQGEVPVDKDNHGMDCLRYFAAERARLKELKAADVPTMANTTPNRMPLVNLDRGQLTGLGVERTSPAQAARGIERQGVVVRGQIRSVGIAAGQPVVVRKQLGGQTVDHVTRRERDPRLPAGFIPAASELDGAAFARAGAPPGAPGGRTERRSGR